MEGSFGKEFWIPGMFMTRKHTLRPMATQQFGVYYAKLIYPDSHPGMWQFRKE